MKYKIKSQNHFWKIEKSLQTKMHLKKDRKWKSWDEKDLKERRVKGGRGGGCWICAFAGFSSSFDILKKQIESIRQVSVYNIDLTCKEHLYTFEESVRRFFFCSKTPTETSRWGILLQQTPTSTHFSIHSFNSWMKQTLGRLALGQA